MSLTLYIGNKAYSSWSLRAWLAVQATGVACEEVRIPLYRSDSGAELARVSPTRRVPVLRDGSLVVWDSLAICEYLAERFPDAGLWPSEGTERAWARSVSAEMHSGFAALRDALPMNVRATGRRAARSAAVDRDIARVCEIWRECRAASAERGPWLFGRFCIADAMYAPVATRFHTYGVDCGPIERAYVGTIRDSPAMRSWITAARAEDEVIAHNEVGVLIPNE